MPEDEPGSAQAGDAGTASEDRVEQNGDRRAPSALAILGLAAAAAAGALLVFRVRQNRPG